ncbi:MAG: hypothetical protein AAGF20_07655 [Pseudomonadota bacterium]
MTDRKGTTSFSEHRDICDLEGLLENHANRGKVAIEEYCARNPIGFALLGAALAGIAVKPSDVSSKLSGHIPPNLGISI